MTTATLPSQENQRRLAQSESPVGRSARQAVPASPPLRAGSYRVGFIGAGFIADWHAKAAGHLRHVHLLAVCDRHAGRRKAFADRYGIQKRYGDWADMLNAESLDAVHVLLPPHLHVPAAKDALAAGVNVLVEKPLGVTVEDVEELVALAEERNTYLAVGHNFGFDPCYEQLRDDLRAGVLGRVDQVAITWNRELPQILHATPNQWMFERPENLMLEVGPHSVAHMLDLMGGLPDDLSVRAENARTLSNGRECYRRWLVDAHYGETLVRLAFSFVPGFTEHTVHVRGSLASATADLEGWTYDLRRHSQYQDDFDRYHMARRRAASLARQARRNIGRYIAGKFKLSQRSNQYGYSIQRACEAFYRGIDGERDERIDGETGLEVIRTCVEIGERANLGVRRRDAALDHAAKRGEVVTGPCAIQSGVKPPHSKTLVLGGTGFIGRELVRQLVAAGHGVRVLARDTGRFEGDPLWEQVDVIRGDLSHDEDLGESMHGVETVYHLARAYGNTWEDFTNGDLPWTRRIAEQCLEHNVGRLVFSGTIDSYYAGRRGEVITEQTPLDPKIHLRKPYARAKAQAEAMLLEMHHTHGLPLVIVRPGIVIGPGGDPFHWGVGMFTHQAVAHLWGDGRNPLPFVLVQDVAAALVAIKSAQGIDGESFNLIGDPLLSAREYVEELEGFAGIRLQVRPTPIAEYYLADMAKYAVKVLVRHPGRYRPSYRDWQGRTQLAHFDCSKAKRVLDWKPTTDRQQLIELGIHAPAREFLF